MDRGVTLSVLITLLAGVSIFADDLSLAEVAGLVADNDPTVQIAGRTLSTAQNAYELLKASVRPQVQATQAPSYSFSGTKVPDPADPFGPSSLDLDVHNISLGLGVTQALPTDGVLTANLSNLTTVTKTADDVQISQSPALSVTVSQPLFLNGKIIDFDIFQARKDTQGRIPIAKAASQEVAARNGAIIAAATAYTTIVELRNSLSTLERNIELSNSNLLLTKIRADQGSVTLRDVWTAELAIETLQEQLLELKFALLETEQLLGRQIGNAAQVSDTVLVSTIPVIEHSFTMEAVIERAMSVSSEILQNTLSLEESDRNVIIGGRQYASDLTVAFSLDSEYAVNSVRNDDLNDSFADLFSDGAYLSPSLSVGLSVPVYQGGQKKYQDKLNEDARFIAQATLESSRQKTVSRVSNLFLRREMLAEKSDFVSQSYALEVERLSDRQRLFELKSITELDLAQSQLKVDEKKLDVWRTRADIFLNALEILSTAGHDIQTIIEG